MLRKYRALFFGMLAVILSVAVIVGISLYHSEPILPSWEKEKIQANYGSPIIWYDENGHKEEIGVWRYVGKYGKCYAILKYGVTDTLTVQPADDPCVLLGLSREVIYPNAAMVMLYHTEREGDRFAFVSSVPHREEWLTDAQLEELTRDIEKIAKSH